MVLPTLSTDSGSQKHHNALFVITAGMNKVHSAGCQHSNATDVPTATRRPKLLMWHATATSRCRGAAALQLRSLARTYRRWPQC